MVNIESQIDNMLFETGLSDEARATLLGAKAILVAFNHRLLHLDGFTSFVSQLKKLNNNLEEVARQLTYIRGKL